MGETTIDYRSDLRFDPTYTMSDAKAFTFLLAIATVDQFDWMDKMAFEQALDALTKREALESSNALLSRKVEILEKCAEHYADEGTWDCRDYWCVRNHPKGDCPKDGYVDDGHGYTIAQRALEAVKVGGEKDVE